MRKFSNKFFKQISFESNKGGKALEKRVKDFQFHIQHLDSSHEYLTCKNKLKAGYDDMANKINGNNKYEKHSF